MGRGEGERVNSSKRVSKDASAVGQGIEGHFYGVDMNIQEFR